MAISTKKPTAKKAVSKPTAKKAAASKSVKDTTAKGALTETIVNRVIKYRYPEDINDTLKKKSWRQVTRNKLKSLTMATIGKEGKELKAANKELADYQAIVLL